MKRRQFIKNAGAAASLPIFLNGMQLTAMPRSSFFNFINPESDRVLVLIQMNGGNDGLNMLIPRDQYDGIAAVRSNVMIPENKVLALTDQTGLHPSMQSIKNIYEEGRIGVVQAVGYPNQNRSHFRSSDIWTSASPSDQFWSTGWLGRHFETNHTNFPEGYPNADFPHPFAITMGSIVSETCQGTTANFSMTLEDPFNISPLYQGIGSTTPDTPYGRELTFLRTSIAQTNAYADVITIAANSNTNQVTYPENNRLAQQLKNIALLIAGGLQTKVYVASIGGFDTHANQVAGGDTTTGDHAELLLMLSEAIVAFQNDLKALRLEERVIGVTFSEFGRRIRSNESFGTDHGTAAPLIVFGSCVNPTILGENPEIARDVDPDEGVPMQYDFRDVYGSILMDWFDLSETDVKTLLHEGFQKLPIIQDCRTTTAANDPSLVEQLILNIYPNPVLDRANIEFTLERDHWVRLSVFDALGSEIGVLTNKNLPAGLHQVPFEAKELPAGTYFCRLQVDHQVQTKRIVLIGSK